MKTTFGMAKILYPCIITSFTIYLFIVKLGIITINSNLKVKFWLLGPSAWYKLLGTNFTVTNLQIYIFNQLFLLHFCTYIILVSRL